MTGGAPPQGSGSSNGNHPGGYPPGTVPSDYGSPVQQSPGQPYAAPQQPMYGVSPGQPGYVPSGVQQPYAQSPYGTPTAGMPLGVQPNAGGAMGGGYQPQGYPPPAGGYGAPSGGYGNPPQGFGAPPGYSPIISGASPEAPYGIDPITGLPFSDKQKIVAGLLQIFFGCFGVGRFYIGHTGMGIAQIAVSFLTCGVGTIWPFIDGILMLTGKVTDAQGRPLRDG